MDKGRDAHRVARAIKLALALIAEQDPELARLLCKTIKMGEYLSYSLASQPTRPRRSRRAKKTRHWQGSNPSRPD
jgi:hypothetical protein